MNKEMFCAAAHDLKPTTCIVWFYINLLYQDKKMFAAKSKDFENALGICRTQVYLSIKELKEKNYLTYDEESRTYSF